jgi:NADH-quinone oxidoreductase subunit F
MNDTRPLTSMIDPRGEPPDRAAYERGGGYEAARRALTEMSREEVRAEVTASGLRGRGGAGFPTGNKWSFVPMGEEAPHPKYLLANADEMEPGTFKDRLLLEGNPHQLIEGMIISAYAIDATVAYIFLRFEYRLAAQRLRRALDEAYEAHYLGPHLFGTAQALELHLHVSAGRYMCGEETGLLSALEGKRATPRAKPPYPQLSGLFGKPTIVQNVETLACVPHILRNGAAWFKTLGRSQDSGTKLYGASGQVRRPGLWELPMGTSAREVLEEHAGGMREGHKLRGFLPGGASTDFLLPEHLDVPLDFEAVTKVGSRLGTGTIVVLDDHHCPVGMVHNLMRFFAQESCGWCTPCRDGLPWTAKILAALEAGEGEAGDLEQLERHSLLLGPGRTFCALAPGATEPLGSALKYFRDDFERHLRERRCPWRAP